MRERRGRRTIRTFKFAQSTFECDAFTTKPRNFERGKTISKKLNGKNHVQSIGEKGVWSKNKVVNIRQWRRVKKRSREKFDEKVFIKLIPKASKYLGSGKEFNGVGREVRLNKMVVKEEDWVSSNTNRFNKGQCDEKTNGVARGMRGKKTMLGKVKKFKKFKKFFRAEIIFVIKFYVKVTYKIK